MPDPARPLLMMATLVTTLGAPALAAPGPLAAQTDVSAELGASRVGPPVGVDAEPARFIMGGLRAAHHLPSGSGVTGRLLFGRALGSATGGDFVSAEMGATLASRWSASWTGTLDLTALGFSVQAPFPYRAYAAEGGPGLLLRAGHASLRLRGVAGIGTSRVELRRRTGDAVRVVSEELWRLGATSELLFGSGGTWLGVGGGMHRTRGGSYRTGGLRLVLGATGGVAELRADLWDTPSGTETIGGIAVSFSLGPDWSLRGFLGKSEPDPLTLAEPGSGSGGGMVGRSLYHRDVTPAEPALYDVLARTDAGARIRMRLRTPEGASRVELLGDFNLWTPVAMRREGDHWVAELDVALGTHHYGFLIDGAWYVPDEARDVVPDDWGRTSAILVIEGES